MDFSELIPKDKHETEKGQQLVNMLGEALAEGIELEEMAETTKIMLEWIADINWPLAAVFIPFLEKIAPRIIPQILEVLKGNDSMWKYWCLIYLIQPNYPNPDLLPTQLKARLTQLADYPSPNDTKDEVSLMAREILQGKK